MNKNIKNIYTFFLIFFIYLFISCGDSFSSVEKTSVTIRQFESYAVTDMDDLNAAFLYSGISSDSAVASLREGKYIYGNGIGTADITVTDGNTETVYNVTVTQNSEHNFRPAISETRGEEEELTQENCYIGYCYNAFSGKEFDHRCINDLKKVFDWDTIIENQNYFIMEDTPSYKTNSFSVGSKSQYITSYENQFSASVSAKFMGNTVYSKKWSDKTLSQSETSSQKEINNVYVCACYLGFYLNDDGEDYWKYLLPEVKEELKNLSPEQFINQYGTHVILGTSFGQSFEANYIKGVGSDFRTCFSIPKYINNEWKNDFQDVSSLVFNEKLLDYKNYVNFWKAAEAEVKGNKESLKKWQMSVVLEEYEMPYYWYEEYGGEKPGNGTFIVIGGPTEKEIRALYPLWVDTLEFVRISSPDKSLFNGYLEQKQVNWEMMLNAYGGWFISNLDNRECDRLVGPWDEHSLMPIWEIIPDDLDWAAAKKAEFEKYVNSHVER